MGATLDPDDVPDYEPLVKIHRTFEDVFVTSWGMYLRQTETNEISLTLKKRVKETLLAKKTANAYLSNSFNWHFDNPNDTDCGCLYCIEHVGACCTGRHAIVCQV